MEREDDALTMLASVMPGELMRVKTVSERRIQGFRFERKNDDAYLGTRGVLGGRR